MFFWGGGLWATSTDPLTLQKKTKEAKHKPKKNNTNHRKKTKETQNTKKQKPEHNNLICETTTTTRTKRKNTEIQNQQKERPTQKNKGFEGKCKNLKNLQKNSVF